MAVGHGQRNSSVTLVSSGSWHFYLSMYMPEKLISWVFPEQVQKIVKSTTVKKLDFDLLMEAIVEVAPHKVFYSIH